MPMIDHALGFVEAVTNRPSGMNVTVIARTDALASPAGVSRRSAAMTSAVRAALKRRMASTDRSTSGPTNTDITAWKPGG